MAKRRGSSEQLGVRLREINRPDLEERTSSVLRQIGGSDLKQAGQHALPHDRPLDAHRVEQRDVFGATARPSGCSLSGRSSANK